jgi:antitoxin (DNA-binding transcriptional repressor) of toxin-antitoxin stability system
MPEANAVTTIGVEPVRRDLAGLTHRIMTGGESFIVERYGRPVAYLGPAYLPWRIRQACDLIRAGRATEALGLLERLAGDDGRPAAAD